VKNITFVLILLGALASVVSLMVINKDKPLSAPKQLAFEVSEIRNNSAAIKEVLSSSVIYQAGYLKDGDKPFVTFKPFSNKAIDKLSGIFGQHCSFFNDKPKPNYQKLYCGTKNVVLKEQNNGFFISVYNSAQTTAPEVTSTLISVSHTSQQSVEKFINPKLNIDQPFVIVKSDSHKKGKESFNGNCEIGTSAIIKNIDTSKNPEESIKNILDLALKNPIEYDCKK
jgi:hypothetical protein